MEDRTIHYWSNGHYGRLLYHLDHWRCGKNTSGEYFVTINLSLKGFDIYQGSLKFREKNSPHNVNYKQHYFMEGFIMKKILKIAGCAVAATAYLMAGSWLGYKLGGIIGETMVAE